MNTIKNSFSIYDLENLTGIKAHTIRIWEKRYNLLNPTRLNRNVRVYTLDDLQKILNVSLLLKFNYKISKLSKLTDVELAHETKTISTSKQPFDYQINSLLVSLFTFDEALFQQVYDEQINKMTFQEIFINIYLPLLNYIGILWQTNSIQPANEHFMTNLIYQKIALNTALIDTNLATSLDNQVFVLFLPEDEIHEIGLLFLNYYLKLTKKKVIYLGRSVPFDNLLTLNSQFEKTTWVSAFLLDKTDEFKQKFISEIEKLTANTENKFWIIGKVWGNFPSKTNYKNINFYNHFGEVINKIIK